MLGGAKKTIVGLDVGSYSVKAVALSPNKGRVTLQGYAQMRVGEHDQGVVIRQVIDQLGIKPKQMVSAVSGRSVIVRQVETPPLQGSALNEHIEHEADKYIPFGTDEVVIDCQPTGYRHGEAEDANQEVLLVAVRRNFVEDHVATLNAAGVHPSVVDVDVFALVNAFQALGPRLGGEHLDGEGEEDDEDQPPPQHGAIALVDIGAAKSWVAIVKDGRLLFQREIYLAGNEITDAIARTFNESVEDVEAIKLSPGETLEALLDAAMPALEDLANEVRLSFDYVEGQFDEDVSSVVLSGATSQMPQLAEILGNILGKPVQVFDPLSGVDLVPSKYDLHGLDANAPSLTVALGLACHELDDDIAGLGGYRIASWRTQGSSGSAVGGAATPMAYGRDEPDEPSPAAGLATTPPPAPPPPPTEPSPTSVSPVRPPPVAEAPPIPIPNDSGHYDFESLQASMPPPEDEPPIAAPPPVHDLGATPEAAPHVPPPDDAYPFPEGDEEAPQPPSSGVNRRSSMLVVLDDEDYSTEEFRKMGGKSPRDGTAAPAESDDNDDLPPLPR